MKVSFKTALALCAAIFAANASASAANLGYCSDNINRNNIFRMGSTEKQGLAIRLDSEKLQALKGCTISSISASFGSSRTTDGMVDLFIATAPDADPIVSQRSKISGAVKWLDFALDNPYTITGDEDELYIGYTGTISVKSSMLMSDYTDDISGCCYVYNDGSWVDTYGLGYGNASIRVGIADAPQLVDMMIKPVTVNGYFRAEREYALKGQLFNFGTLPVTGFDISVSVDGATPVVLSYTDCNIAPNATFDFDLPEFASPREGNLPIDIRVVNVNGGADATPTDNVFNTPLFFYPKNMERSILLEGFTGQDCSNCPSGHSILNAFLESGLETPVIEVMHHSGYQPDQFTMDSDLDYTYFYGGSNTFAPAVMVNRAVYPTVGSVPVMNVGTSLLNTAYTAAEASEPYASLSLETSFDPSTSEVNVTLNVLTHTDIPDGIAVINVMLVQDNLIARQVPYGEGYVHNGVYRGVLTGNSWGKLLDESSTVRGGKATWSTKFTLPEYIFSDYWAPYNLPAEQKLLLSTKSIPEDMRVVAYIGRFENGNVAGHTIYNAVEAPLGKSHVQGGYVSVQSVMPDAADAPAVRVIDGRVAVDGKYDSLTVTAMDGRSIDPRSTLKRGIYIVRAADGKHVTVKKVMVK